MTAQIHIFSGLASSVFSSLRKGTDELERVIDGLPSSADAQTHIWNDWKDVAKNIVAARKGGNASPIILIGHSNGVLACAEVAQVLYRRGIDVDYMAAIDPTLKSFPVIQNNVKLIDEFHASRGFVALGRWFSRGKKASIITAKRYKGTLNKKKYRASHVGVVSLAAVRKRIKAVVVTTL